MSSPQFSRAVLRAVLIVAPGILTAACAATPARLTGPAPARAVPPPVATPPPAEPAAAPPPAADLAPPAQPSTAPLAWVNPARCLSPCAFEPAAALRRVNERADADPKGRHRVEATALAALRELLAAARTAGHDVKISSAYRSYDDQVRVFRTTKEQGRAARPGHSEHQLGTAVDLRLPTKRAIDWLAAHAADHGFVLSYPPGKQRITGYRPEPWHVRFVGREVASEASASGSLEELFRHRPALAESGTCADCPAAGSRKPCGRVTTDGLCEGTVLSFCFDGALAAVDCAAFRHTCHAAAGTIPDCVPAPDQPGDAASADAADAP